MCSMNTSTHFYKAHFIGLGEGQCEYTIRLHMCLSGGLFTPKDSECHNEIVFMVRTYLAKKSTKTDFANK